MMALNLEVVYKYQSVPPGQMWQAVVSGRPSAFPEDREYEIGERTCSRSEVQTAIEVRRKPHFGVTCPLGEIHFGAIGNCNLSLLFFDGRFIESNSAAIEWMESLVRVSGFIHGRAYDQEYEFWQNASDPLSYKVRGRSTEGLTMKSNGLPYPLEQDVIDTSNNPGRRIMRDGYIEAVGHLMWFGGEFWRRTKQPRCIPQWVQEHRRVEDVDFVQLCAHPFLEGDGTEELQRRARRAFFSGTAKSCHASLG